MTVLGITRPLVHKNSDGGWQIAYCQARHTFEDGRHIYTCLPGAIVMPAASWESGMMVAATLAETHRVFEQLVTVVDYR